MTFKLTWGFYTGGLPFDGSPIEQQSLGGSESALWFMGRELAKRGQRVEIYCNCPNPGKYGDVLYRDSKNFPMVGPVGEWDVFVAHRFAAAHGLTRRSRLNWTWHHDMPQDDNAREVIGDLWKSEQNLFVSEFHKQAYVKLEPELERLSIATRNGVDLDMLKACAAGAEKKGGVLVYASRPERGLFRLLSEIWPKLHDWRPNLRLAVCSYDMRSYAGFTPSMRRYYDDCGRLLRETAGVVDTGALPKQAFYRLLAEADLVIYPTSFPEVSCLVALEAMALGTPIVTSAAFALTETAPYAGVPGHDKPGYVDAFIARVREVLSDELEYKRLQKLGKTHVYNRYQWRQIAEEWEARAYRMLEERSRLHHPRKIFDQLVYQSDLVAARAMIDYVEQADWARRDQVDAFAGQRPWLDEILQHHHEEPDAYSEGAGEQVNAGWDVNSRFGRIVSMIPKGRLTVLEVGCGAGGLVARMHKERPGLRVVGVDFSRKLVERAVRFLDEVFPNDGEVPVIAQWDATAKDAGGMITAYDVVIASEVLEHQVDTQAFVAALERLCKKGGTILLTVPSGPWEAISFRKPAAEAKNDWDKNRFHLHHFEKRDLEELFGQKAGFLLGLQTAAVTDRGEPLGWYFVTWKKATEPTGKVDYARKFTVTRPHQKLAYCMIVKDEEDNLARNLRSIIDVPDEIHILDTGSTDATAAIVEKFQAEKRYEPKIFYRRVAWEDVRPPKAGADASKAERGIDLTIEERRLIDFGRARNLSIAQALDGQVDWILWADADEIFRNARGIRKYLDGVLCPAYVMRQRHVTLDMVPQRPDTPYRLFRTGIGIRFIGCVHEQPAFDVNRNAEPALVLGDTDVVHFGYMDVAVARFKASARNMPLVGKDRYMYPARILGRMNAMRDMTTYAGIEIEAAGGLNEKAAAFLRAAVAIFQETFKDPKHIYYPYALEVYENALKILGQAGVGIEPGMTGVPFEVQMQTILQPGGIPDTAQIPSAQRRWFATPEEYERYLITETRRLFGLFGAAYDRQDSGNGAADQVRREALDQEVPRGSPRALGGRDSGDERVDGEVEAGRTAAGE